MAKLIEEFENKVLSRKEVVIDMEFTGATPSAEEVTKRVSQAFKVEPDVVAVRTISTHFGEPKVTVAANIYSSKEMRQKMEPEKKAKEKPAKPEAPAEKPAKEKPEEKAEKKPVKEEKAE